MSNYVYGSGVSYLQYLQAKSFVGDISSASRKAGREISMEISRQTREIIASNEALARENIRVSERQHHERLNAIYGATDHIAGAIDAASDRITGALSEGFDRVTYQLQDISAGISEINATFHWGFSQMIAGIGHMNDALSELIKIAKTPVQTVAFNHFEIARDAFRQGLYQEALEELSKAIQGDHTSPGYKLEWRFHQMVGTIQLGFTDCDLSLVDLAQAEQSFLLAARYAKTDYQEDAARAFLSAGWAAYCQGKMKEALAHTEQAIAFSPKLTEALFQGAKVHMALGKVDSALPILCQAIDRDRFYILKAAGDGDFQKHDERLRDFFEALRHEEYQHVSQKVQTEIDKVNLLRGYLLGKGRDTDWQYIEAFLNHGEKWPLFDILSIAQNLDIFFSEVTDYFIEFCVIPAGQFIMGEKEHQRQVNIPQDFYIGKYPITQGQWQVIMGSNPSHFKGDPNLPVENVSWDDCQTFIIKLNNLAGKKIYRLPTEEEWEYACRAGSTTEYYFGNDVKQLDQHAWYQKNSDGKTHPVGKLKPNGWDLYDMLGNVWEWTDTLHDKMWRDHVVRGSAWDDLSVIIFHCGCRDNNGPSYCSNNLGFRLVRSKQH